MLRLLIIFTISQQTILTWSYVFKINLHLMGIVYNNRLLIYLIWFQKEYAY
jgi:hypothetical protein